MASTCENRLTLIGPSDDVRDFIRRARSVDPEVDETGKTRARSVLSFGAFVPLDDSNHERQDGCYGSERAAWGVKWGAYNERLLHTTPMTNGRGKIGYYFETAYKPPHLFLQRVSVIYPGITFFLSFGEESPTRGRWVIANGRITYVVNEKNSPDYHEKDSPDFLEDEDAMSEAFTKWQRAYLEDHDEWVRDAAFASSLEGVISS